MVNDKTCLAVFAILDNFDKMFDKVFDKSNNFADILYWKTGKR
jgi:hypothetical protein